MAKLFVYGTLRAGFGNHRVMEDVGGIFLASAKTVKKYALYARGIPFVTDKEEVSEIVGEVYDITEQALERLDRFEGHPRWYTRKAITVITADGATEVVWLYFNDHPEGKLIESGDYADNIR